MGSGTYGPSGLDSSSSLEHALDQAIARRFAGVQERTSKKRRHSPTPMMAALNASAEQSAATATFEHTAPLGSARPSVAPATPEQTAELGRTQQTGLTVTNEQTTALAVMPSRLSWRGIEVTAEFQLYAARVALGEALAPYRGAVLSRPCSEFPWGSPTSTTVPTPTLPRYRQRGRSLGTLLWLGGAALSIVAALGIGAGAASASKTDNGVEAYDPVRGTAALRPMPVSARDDSRAPLQSSAVDDTLEASLAAELAPLSAEPAPLSTRGGEPPIATAVPQRKAPARVPALSRPPEARSRVPAAMPIKGAGLNAPHVLTSRQDASSPAPPSSNALAVRESTLFSDSPSF